jgi:type III secretory pathway component EscS
MRSVIVAKKIVLYVAVGLWILASMMTRILFGLVGTVISLFQRNLTIQKRKLRELKTSQG